MREADPDQVVGHVRALVEAHYVFPDVAVAVSGVLAAGLAEGRYPADPPALAKAVTADLRSVSADQHLGLKYLDPARPRGGDGDGEFAAMARWADRTCGGVGCVRRTAGNVGYLSLQPVLFPVVMAGEHITAAMTLLAATDALMIDLRRCSGGDPAIAAFLISYLWDHEPAQLSGLRGRADSQVSQTWTLPYVPGRRFGRAKPAYLLTSAATFSGAEQVCYDLQQLGRATVVGERTRGGAHASTEFRVHPLLDARIPVAKAVHPKTGGNWEGTGVVPDVETTAGQAQGTARELALQDVIAAGGTGAARARAALAAARGGQARPGRAGPGLPGTGRTGTGLTGTGARRAARPLRVRTVRLFRHYPLEPAPAVDVEFLVRVRQVKFHGPLREHQFLRDLPVREPSRRVRGHCQLPPGQCPQPGRGPAWPAPGRDHELLQPWLEPVRAARARDRARQPQGLPGFRWTAAQLAGGLFGECLR